MDAAAACCSSRLNPTHYSQYSQVVRQLEEEEFPSLLNLSLSPESHVTRVPDISGGFQAMGIFKRPSCCSKSDTPFEEIESKDKNQKERLWSTALNAVVSSGPALLVGVTLSFPSAVLEDVELSSGQSDLFGVSNLEMVFF